MTKKTIYLIRHGQTDFNVQGIVQGSGVDSSLNDTGNQQAQKFYDFYKAIPFDLVITSALQRTIQTATPFIQKPIPHKIYSEFNEINWGKLEGIKPSIESKKAFHKVTRAWGKGKTHLNIGEGESPEEVRIRVQMGLEKLKQETVKTILLVSHGRAMRIMLCTMLNIPLSKMDDFPHTNTSLYHLNWDLKSFKLNLQNDTKHLEKR